MADLKQRILDIIKKPQLAGLATITEDGKPWVRYMMTVGSDDLKIRCCTFVNARKVKQLEKNPEVHITCGVTSLTEMKPYLQIQGRAQVTTETSERHAFWNDELKEIFSGPDDPTYGIIVVTPYRIELNPPGSYEAEIWEA